MRSNDASLGIHQLWLSFGKSGIIVFVNDQHDIARAARDVPVVRNHSRLWRDNRYVYPVVSRRAKGLSIGVNLSPAQRCNFRCVYCQVDRRDPPAGDKVDLGTLIRELNAMLDWVTAGAIWTDPHFADVPAVMRRLNDIAFSGDGEPTSYRNFADMVQVAADAKARHKLKDVKITVISNASRFHTQTFRKALPVLQGNNGEVWAKLDAGSPGFFARVNQTRVPFRTVLANIEWLARVLPIVIQSFFFRIDGQGPSETEIELYIARLVRVLSEGGQIKWVQVYSVARPPSESCVSALGDRELDAIASRVRDALGTVRVEVFYGADVPPQRP